MDPFIIEQKVDLNRENTPMRYTQPLLKGNKKAHKWRVTVNAGGKAADLTGVIGTLWLTYGAGSEGNEMSAIAKASVEGNVVSVVFPAGCYARAGEAVVVLELSSGEAVIGVAVMTLHVRETKASVVIDEDDIVPDIDELILEIENAKAATAAASAAAYTANAAANAANSSARANPYINTENNRWMTWDADTGAYKDTGIPATGPKGDAGSDGETPYIGSNGNWWVGETDTGIKAQGPAGANGTGSGTVTSVNGIEPDPQGNVALSASDVGALPADGVAADASKLGGHSLGEIMLKIYPVGAIYASTAETSPASLFGGTWEQLKDRFLLGAGDSYAAGSTGGEATVILEESNLPGRACVLDAAESTENWNAGVWNNITPAEANDSFVNYAARSSYGAAVAHNNMPPYLTVYMWKRVS